MDGNYQVHSSAIDEKSVQLINMRVFGSPPFYFLLIFSIVSLVGCDYGRRNYQLHAKVANAPQVRSVSFLGQSGASLVHEQHRDLRVTIDGGQNWEVFPATSVVDGFE